MTRQPSDFEIEFITRWRQIVPNMPEPEPEYKFWRMRKWRFDFAWVEKRVAVECEGGVYSGGRHTRGSGFTGDCYKYNIATALGWRVLRFTREMFRDNPIGCINQVVMLIDAPVVVGATLPE